MSEHLRVSAETVVINVGSTPMMPPIDGVDHPRVYDSTTIQHADPFPRRLTIIGGGPIGLEFASMYSDFGTEVTVLVRGEQILPDEEPVVRDAVVAVLTEKGIILRTGADAEAIEQASGTGNDGGGPAGGSAGPATGGTTGVRVRVKDGEPVEADAVLVPTGRRRATDRLDLDRAGVDTDDQGAVIVDDQLRTSAEGVFAMGDVHGGLQETYLSLDDHRVVLSAVAGDSQGGRHQGHAPAEDPA